MSDATTTHLSLPTAAPFAASALHRFLTERSLDSLDAPTDRGVRRALRTRHGHGVIEVTFPTAPQMADRSAEGSVIIHCSVHLTEPEDLDEVVRAVRAWLDLDADPTQIDAHLGADPYLAARVRAQPGLRVPGSLDPFETACRAVIGQQVSVAGARTVAARLVSALGEPLHVADRQLTRLFPTPAAIRAAPDELFAMPQARRTTVRTLAAAVEEGGVDLTVRTDNPPETIRAALLNLKGIGPWTADYITMRALGERDVFLGTDLGVVRALAATESTPVDPSAWQPYRSYALHHLWQTRIAG